MLIFIGICIGFIIYFYFYRNNFFSELAISFLPYVIVCCCIMSLILIFLIIYYKFNKVKYKSLNIFLSIILILLSTGMGYLYYTEFSNFYNQADENIRLYNTEGLKIFYANILYTNADFKSLQKTIEDENPDIVILVEFSDAHEQQMKDFFQERYPYVNRNSWSITLAGNVIFSKYPLTNLMENYISDKGSRSYGYVNINCKNIIPECNESGINLYVIHTAAPISLENFHTRNNQLQKLANDFKGNKNDNPTIIIGDFNVSPRSYYYGDLTNSLGLKNALSFQSPNYTWSLLQKKIFCSHIDQLFISDKIKISKIQISDLSGSDHRSFSFSIGLH